MKLILAFDVGIPGWNDVVAKLAEVAPSFNALSSRLGAQVLRCSGVTWTVFEKAPGRK